MPDPNNFLRALSDRFTPVRALDGRLLGCVPRIPDTAEALRGSNGLLYELRISAQVCVCVNIDDPLQSPSALDGFIPLIDGSSVTPADARGDDPDLAIGV